MDLPDETYVRAVPNSADVVAFNYGFTLTPEGKSAGDFVAQIDESSGDLLIEGYAAEFEGEDRDGENFTDGAFQKGIKSFMTSGSSPLCYHHKTSKQLGKVLELEEVPGRGLHMVARIDGAIQKHPELSTYYEQIKKGSMNSLSVGGFFGRTMTPKGPRISECDFTEISVTPVPVHAKPAFAVVAGKALTLGEDDTDELDPEGFSDMLASLDATLDKLTAAFPEGKAAPEPKGDYDDLHSLALILALEQITNQLDDDEDNPGDAKVDALIEKVKVCLDDISKEAHSLAAKLGPLPKVTWAHEAY